LRAWILKRSQRAGPRERVRWCETPRRSREALRQGVVLVSIVGLVVFLVAQNAVALVAARVLNGLGVGLFTGAGTAALTELSPTGDTQRAATHAATTSIVGFALGPVVGGVFGEYLPWPLRLVYVFGLVMLVPALAVGIFMRETVVRSPFALRLQRLGIPRAGLRAFGLASLVALASFMTASFFQSLGTTVVTRVLGIENLAVAGVTVMCFLGTSALAQVRCRGMEIRSSLLVGLLVLPAGVGLVAVSLFLESLPLFVAGALVGGAGQGIAYLGGQSLVERLAPAESRGEVFSAYLIVVYYTGGVAAICLGLAAKHYGLEPASVAYVLAGCATSLLTAFLALRFRLPSARAVPEGVTPAA
jgi:MFS family permease